mmetsp:Transcript_60742/g.108384  ORF Transcript_60742/g.108384 Transcript_60742/m.108384 type:complete len:206 (+) Transcript_60742:595-1212(+)
MWALLMRARPSCSSCHALAMSRVPSRWSDVSMATATWPWAFGTTSPSKPTTWTTMCRASLTSTRWGQATKARAAVIPNGAELQGLMVGMSTAEASSLNPTPGASTVRPPKKASLMSPLLWVPPRHVRPARDPAVPEWRSVTRRDVCVSTCLPAAFWSWIRAENGWRTFRDWPGSVRNTSWAVASISAVVAATESVSAQCAVSTAR